MKKKQLIALLTALAMVLGILPCIALAAESTLVCSDSYISSTGTSGVYTQDGFTTRPYALSWTGGTGNGYRMGVLAFDASELDKTETMSTAKLQLTVYKTQNINQSGAKSTVTVYAFDPSLVDNTNASKPVNGKKVGVITLTGAPTQQTDVNITYTTELSLSSYFADYPNAEKIALYLTNRGDIAECNSFGLVGFYGKDDGAYAPKLVVEMEKGASVKLSFKDQNGNLLKENAAISGYVAGESFTPDDVIAPEVLVVDGNYYTRTEVAATVLAEGLNEIEVVYAEAEIEGFESPKYMIGTEPMLPSLLKLNFKGGSSTLVAVDSWASVDELPTEALVPVNVAYRIKTETAINGETEFDVTVIAYPCDGIIGSFVSSGASSGAHFSQYNLLGIDFSKGNAIFEAEFTINEGSNKLISYGNAATGSFDGAGALMRFMNTNVFEYYDGEWKPSGVACETGKTYRLITMVNIDDKTYRMYVTGEDGVTVEVTNGPAAFRNQSLTNIDRIFVHGCGDEGAVDGAMLSHRSSWIDGYTVLTVKYETADGTTVKEPFTIKYAAGSTYTMNNAEKLIELDGLTYILDNVNVAPSHEVAEDEDEFVVIYNPVEVDKALTAEVNVVVGEASYSLPSQVKVQFTDGQFLKYDVEWNTADVDLNVAGVYTVDGSVTSLGIDAQCIVNVKTVIDLPKTSENTVATNNGGWNWYVEPSGTHIQAGDALATRFESITVDPDGTQRPTYSSNNGYKFTEDKTYMGWVEDGGDIVVGELNHKTGEYKRSVIHEKLESDDHNNPAVVVLPDGRIMAVYSMHTNEAYMYYRVTKNPEDISEWNDEQYYHCQSVTPDDTDVYNATYPTVFMVRDDEGKPGNDVIYMGWRGVHWKPTFAKFSMPDENGVCRVVMHQTQFANTTYNYSTYDGNDAPNAKTDGGKTDSGRRPYTKYDYDYERNKIYITFTANHPDNDRRNHIFYLELDIPTQTLRTAKGTVLQPLPFENQQIYRTQGANGTSGQWGVVTADLVEAYPELVVFDASKQTGQSFNPRSGNAERRGWTWDIVHNEKGEPCIVYVDVTATPPGPNGSLPTWYVAENGEEGASRAHHYYWYARWDSEAQEWVNTFLVYGGKWWHQNYGQERCYSGGLTFDHNYPGNVIFLAIPVYGKYGNVHEIYRWESDDDGATWTKREPITEDSKVPNARPNAIYNYKMNEDGSNAGPRLLWKTGEYRYWMNYEYKTGVMTDYADVDFITQDDPEMFADADLYIDGEKVDKLPVGEATLNARFTVSNISIGDGKAKLALAHYSNDGELKGISTVDEIIPARSVPQIGMVGAPKLVDDGSASPWAKEDNRSPMGDPEIIVDIDYTADIAEGDKITLFAWDMGIEKAMESIISVPYTATTEANAHIMRETFTYDGTEKLLLDQNEDTFNGWVAKGYNDNGSVAFTDASYVAITKAPFGNTGLHIYRRGGEGLMASHKLPETNGKDYVIDFTIRYINELSWNNTDNAGFTLSHGVPTKKNDYENSSAFQFRHKVVWQDENGRGTNGMVRNTRWFDGNSETNIFHGGIDRTIDTSNMIYDKYDKGDGYFDPNTGTYIHDYKDALMVGSLYHFVVTVHPSTQKIEMTINDGYRTVSHSTNYVDSTSYDWNTNPIDTITFSIGSEKWGEMYIDDFSVRYAE